ncbi:Tyrosine-protein kinase, partial [Paramicrosporidium saccamoebae]
LHAFSARDDWLARGVNIVRTKGSGSPSAIQCTHDAGRFKPSRPHNLSGLGAGDAAANGSVGRWDSVCGRTTPVAADYGSVVRCRGIWTAYLSAVDGVLFGTVEEAPKVLILAVSGLAVYLLGMAALLVPDAHSDLAHRMHPFVAEANLGDIKPSTVKTSKHGRKRIKHREVSIFEDWPAPVPFPAKALYSYRTASGSELPFSRGDELIILDCRGNWWQARNPKTNMTGFVPSNYIQVAQKAKVCKSFDAKDPDEVPVLEGQLIEVMEVHDLMSLVRTVDGKIGSVPTENIEVHPPNTVL